VSLFRELIEDSDLDKEIIKSFKMKDELCSAIYSNNQLKEEIREKLLQISNEFYEYIGVDFFIYDIILAGSLANYNWSKYSDIDVHIIVDFNDIESNREIVDGFFDLKRRLWNISSNIIVMGHEVELYVQDINDEIYSSGIYSILNNEWISVPEKEEVSIEDKMILDKGEEFSKNIDSLYDRMENGEDVTDEIKTLKTKLKKFRQSGLETGGEYSYENLTFKLLRRNGYIEKLINLKNKIKNKKLSLS
jgi:hypothetical protein